MPLRINNNILAINSQRHLRLTNSDLTTRIERLASGLRVNRVADDAAGLAISERIRGQVNGLAQGIRNAEQAINLVQTAEGGLNEVNGILIRMRELAVQSASSTISDNNRQSLNSEFSQLSQEIDRIASVTSYNDTTLLTGFGNTISGSTTASTVLVSATTGVTGAQVSGATVGTYTFTDTSSTDNLISLGNGTVSQTINLSSILDGGSVSTGTTANANFDRLGIQLFLNDNFSDGGVNNRTLLITSGTGGEFQIGSNNSAADRLTTSISDFRTSGTVLNLGSTNVATQSASQGAISSIDSAINRVSSERGSLGAIQNRLTFNIQVNGQALENNQATDSAIRDADVAEEVSRFTRDQILSQSGLAIFAQANILAARAFTLIP